MVDHLTSLLCVLLPWNWKTESEDVSIFADLYKRIKDGVTISKETPELFKKALLRQANVTRPSGRILRSNPSS
jgi:hypothetical protein